ARAALRWTLATHVEPYVALAGGWTHANLSLTPQQGEGFEDGANGIFGRAGLGLRLTTGRFALGSMPGHDLALAAGLEAGGGLGTALSFYLEPRDGRPADAIASQPVHLGQLGQKRTYVRLELALMF